MVLVELPPIYQYNVNILGISGSVKRLHTKARGVRVVKSSIKTTVS